MMKKLKEFTLDELTNLCPQTHCAECPFYPFNKSDRRCGFINELGKTYVLEKEADTEGGLDQLKDIEEKMRKY